MSDLGLALTLDDLPHLIKIAWYHAQAGPESAKETLDKAFADVKAVVARVNKQLCDAAEHERAIEEVAELAIERAWEQHRSDLADLVHEGFDAGFNPHGFFVYCLWGDDTQRPIYVGQSRRILSRLGTHMNDNSKRPRIRKVTLIRCRDERHMIYTESRLIAKYQPELNILGIVPKAAS